MLLALLAAIEFGIFGGYFELLHAGRVVTGHVTNKSSWMRTTTSRSGSRTSRVHGVTVQAEGRSERFEGRASGWEDARRGSPVMVLLSPRTMVLGSTPYTTIGCAGLALSC
jgi:hypothetical protein